MVSARILQGATNDPQNNTEIPRAEVCYDAALATLNNGGNNANDFQLVGYDQGDFVNSTSSRIVVDRPQCVQVDFPAMTDIAGFTIVSAIQGAGIGSDVGGRATMPGSVALEGTRQAPRNGNTNGPDLVGTPGVDATSNTITYTFDRPVSRTAGVPPNGALAPDATKFGFYTTNDQTTANVDAGRRTAAVGMATVQNGTSVRVTFTGATFTAQPPARFFVEDSAVSGLQGNHNVEQSAGAATLRPELTGATQTSANEFRLTYDRPVMATTASVANVIAYTEDGQRRYPGTAFARAGDSNTVGVTFGGVQDFNEKIVGIADIRSAVTDIDGGALSTESYIPVKAAPIAAGFTDGPDLRQVVLNAGSNTATFRFDERVELDSTRALRANVAKNLYLVDASGNLTPGAGNVNSVAGTDVTVQFNSVQIMAAVGGANAAGAVCDFEDDASLNGDAAAAQKTPTDSDCSPVNVLGLGAPAALPGGTGTGTTPTTTGTTPTGTTPTGTGTTPTGTTPTGTTPTGTTTGTTTGGNNTGVTQARLKVRSISGKGRRVGTRQFIISGTVGVPQAYLDAGLTKANICGAPNSRVAVTTKRGTATLSNRRVTLKSNCTYSVRVTFSSTKRFGKATRLKFSNRFLGNKFLAPRSASSFTVKLKKR